MFSRVLSQEIFARNNTASKNIYCQHGTHNKSNWCTNRLIFDIVRYPGMLAMWTDRRNMDKKCWTSRQYNYNAINK